MKKIILIAFVILMILAAACQGSVQKQAESNIEAHIEANDDISAFDEFDVISSTIQADVNTSDLEKKLEDQSYSDINKGPDGEFVFSKEHEKIDINMKEKIFLDMFQDIMMNPEYYMGKTIKVEGMYTEFAYPDGSKYNYVYRYGPIGCPCCDGTFYGLEFTWDEDLPKENDWIEVVGVLDEYMEDGFPFLTLRGVSVKVLEERGKEDLS